MIRPEIEIIKEWLLGVDFFDGVNKYSFKYNFNNNALALEAKINNYIIYLSADTNGEEASIDNINLTIEKFNSESICDYNIVRLEQDEKEMMYDVLMAIYKHIEHGEMIREHKNKSDKLIRDNKMLAEVSKHITESVS